MAETESTTAAPTGKKATNKSEGIHIRFRLPIGKQVLMWAIIPVLVVGLLLFGLIRQGFIGTGQVRATFTLTTTDSANKPVDNAQVDIGGLQGSTNLSGALTVTGVVSKGTDGVMLTIKKTGYLPTSAQINPKKGVNDLGLFVLEDGPAAKITLPVAVSDYISEESVASAIVSADDIRATYDGEAKNYLLTGVPVGSHTLTITTPGYNAFTKTVEIKKDTKLLDPVQIVASGTIVFESNRDQGKRGIFTTNYDGSDQRNLVDRLGDLEDYSPILGPNQRKVFFTSTRDGQKRDGSSEYKEFMYIVDVDGKNLSKVSETSSTYAAWSPDGTFIGYTRYTDNNYSRNELYTYNVVNKSSYEFDGYNASSFAFSNDGKFIAFTAQADGSDSYRLYTAKNTGQSVKEIETQSSYSLEFTSAGKLRYSYWDGSKTRFVEYDLTSGTKKEISAPAIDREGAVLSPDKKLRAYVSTRDGKSNVYLSDPDGKNEKKLTDLNKVTSGNLLWSKDSTFVMYNFRADGESARYLVSINGTAKPKKITDINLTNGYYE